MTSNGYIGLGGLRTKKGDRIVIFDCGETPFILRQAGAVDGVNSWRLISDCHVEGWMDGRYFEHKVLDRLIGERPETVGVLYSERFVVC
jgi:hypothetical protein